MAVFACPWCKNPVPGATETSNNWYCPTCRRFDATRCLSCGMTEGFPRKEPWVAEGDLAKSPWNGQGEFHRKQYVYCEWDFHNAYFVVQDAETGRCLLCETLWDRRKASSHAPHVKMRAG